MFLFSLEIILVLTFLLHCMGMSYFDPKRSWSSMVEKKREGEEGGLLR